MQYLKIIIAFVSISLLATGCIKDPVTDILQPDEDVNLGGKTSVEGVYISIFQQPAANLNAAEQELHLDADKAFGDKFVTAPSTINGGLGPVFNQNSCESCHVSNGRSPFPASANDTRGLLVRLSLAGAGAHGEPLKVPNYGGQLQTQANFGKQPEAHLSWQEVESIKNYADGSNLKLRHFDFLFENLYAPFANNVLTSPRMASPMIGLGLLEAVREVDILALADPNDTNGDGISGKPNRVWDYVKNQTALGRFGWKAAQPTLYQQTAAAYNDDMGVTNPLFRTESSAGQTQSDGFADDPEIDDATLKAAAFYPQSLGVPQRRNTTDATVRAGKALFLDIKCGSCHNPKFTTGQHEYGFLSNQTIYPYTDMLLHDMGDGLADNRPDFEATGREWRTPALWGIGLTQTVGGHTNFLHDGRARSLEEAIMWHGGEAENAKERFRKLTKADRNAVVAFLGSL